MIRPLWLATLWAASALAQPAFAQTAPATAPAAVPMPTFLSSADLDAIVARARADPRSATGTVNLPGVGTGPYRANIDYRRVSTTPAAVHDNEVEFFTVLRGTGAFTSGGTLVDPKRNGANVMGSAIAGGATREVKPGDTFVIPAGTPHWFNRVDGELVALSTHLPK